MRHIGDEIPARFFHPLYFRYVLKDGYRLVRVANRQGLPQIYGEVSKGTKKKGISGRLLREERAAAPSSVTVLSAEDQEVFDSFGRRSTVPTRTFTERKGFLLQPKFVFIDGRTGTTMYSERYREEILYNAQQNTPALSSYFELMDRLVPNFLSALSDQKLKGTRVLLN